MSETVQAIGHKADVPARVGEAVRERIETVRGTVESVGGTVADTSARALSSAMAHPLGIAAGALAIGFLGGLLLPE